MTDILDLIDLTLAECTGAPATAAQRPPSNADIWAMVGALTSDIADPSALRGLISPLRERPKAPMSSPLDDLKRLYETMRNPGRPYFSFTTPPDVRPAAAAAEGFSSKASRFLEELGIELWPWQRVYLEDISTSVVQPVDYFRDDVTRLKIAMRYRIQDYPAAVSTAAWLEGAPREPRRPAIHHPATRSPRIQALRAQYRVRQLARRKRARR